METKTKAEVFRLGRWRRKEAAAGVASWKAAEKGEGAEGSPRGEAVSYAIEYPLANEQVGIQRSENRAPLWLWSVFATQTRPASDTLPPAEQKRPLGVESRVEAVTSDEIRETCVSRGRDSTRSHGRSDAIDPPLDGPEEWQKSVHGRGRS
ncbi:hypothetical protein KM043_010634 [Ampulex compressa]|nr:hypothetical protein KM043_010634 [Ampulex compressa]